MDIALFVNITSRAWALAILSSLHAGVAGRQAPLLAATGASRTAFAQSLEHLVKLRLLERNPGHGHPLRPEFRLTASGRAAAAMASRVHPLAPEKDQDLLRRAWTLPVLTTLHRPRRFNEIRRSLPMITDRALSQTLKRLEGRNWVSRRVDDTVRPPGSLYVPVNAGQLISAAAAPDVRFG